MRAMYSLLVTNSQTMLNFWLGVHWAQMSIESVTEYQLLLYGKILFNWYYMIHIVNPFPYQKLIFKFFAKHDNQDDD